MKNIIGIVFGVAAAFVVAGSAVAGSVVYTNQAKFLTDSGAGPSSKNDFSDLIGFDGPVFNPYGSGQSSTYKGPVYSISSPPDAGYYMLNGAIGAFDGPELQINMLAGGATGVGANFYGVNANSNFREAVMLVGLSDGTTNSIFAQNLTDFLGFVTSGPLITYVQIRNPNFSVDGLYPSMDNLYVVPEPSMILMNLAVLMGVGAGTVYYRRRNTQRG